MLGLVSGIRVSFRYLFGKFSVDFGNYHNPLAVFNAVRPKYGNKYKSWPFIHSRNCIFDSLRSRVLCV